MIAYNSTGLDNRLMQAQADEALAKTCISKEEHASILSKYPVSFYSPNIFIRIGLFLLTIVIAVFSIGLLALLFMSGGNEAFVSFLIISGLICYTVLEILVKSAKHFRSGADDALLWLAIGLIVTGINFLSTPISMNAQRVIIFALSLYAVLRFADMLMTLIAYGALMSIVYFMATGSGETAKAIAPFLFMALSAGLYIAGSKLYRARECRHYRECLTLIKVLSLLCFYVAGNYYAVRETSASLSEYSGSPETSLPLGWLFWILTIGTPLYYIYYGIRKKDQVFLWVGLSLIAAAVFTIRAYHQILPVEWAMTIGGALLIALSWWLTRYLKMPKKGFTSEETNDQHYIQHLPVIESLVIAETFQPTAPAGNDFKFGGGSGGGGGAGGQY
jgi:hypothetical protein